MAKTVKQRDTHGVLPPRAPRSWRRGGVAVLLAMAGGAVEAVGYLTLFHLFMGVMSGNSATLGMNLGLGHGSLAVQHATPILLFLLGVMVGGILMELGARWRLRSPLALVLGVEVLLLAGYVLSGEHWLINGRLPAELADTWVFVLLVTLLAMPMGLQTAALQRVDGQSIHTTFVTGVLTHLTQESTTYLLWRHDPPPGNPISEQTTAQGILPSTPSRRRIGWLIGVLSAYIAGAAVGAYGLEQGGFAVMVLLLAVLLIVIVLERLTSP
ncbi:MAG TPA: YoaK family protein [Candidatus Competibacteraceae bacterium]|nr:YoaK family protein [Candidatus Competibacteraceae bacterium]